MPGLRPSQTNRGRAWLANFAPADQGTAERLIDSVRIATMSEMRLSLRTHLLELVDSGKIPSPAMALPVVSMEDLDAVAGSPPPPGRHVAYETYRPGALIEGLPGSEGWIGGAIRDVISSDPRWVDPTNQSIESLSAMRARSIVLVADFAGSGNQVLRLANTFTRNRFIRSWRSFRWMQIHALTFSSSPRAAAVLQMSRHIDDAHIQEVSATIDSGPWSDSEKDEMKTLCAKYVVYNKKEALGYKNSAGLFAADSGVPNNVPMILRQVTEGWNSFFEDRLMPSDLVAELGSYKPQADMKAVVESIGEHRLSLAMTEIPQGIIPEQLKALLALSATKQVEVIALSVQLAITVAHANELIAFARRHDWLTPSGRITMAGRKELSAGRRRPRRVADKPSESKPFYYPSSLR